MRGSGTAGVTKIICDKITTTHVENQPSAVSDDGKPRAAQGGDPPRSHRIFDQRGCKGFKSPDRSWTSCELDASCCDHCLSLPPFSGHLG